MSKEKFIYVKPGFEGAVIRMPDRGNKIMPAHGARVPNAIYYQRRLADNDLLPTTKKAFEEAEAAVQKTAGNDVNERFNKARLTADEKTPAKKTKATSKASAQEQ